MEPGPNGVNEPNGWIPVDQMEYSIFCEKSKKKKKKKIYPTELGGGLRVESNQLSVLNSETRITRW